MRVGRRHRLAGVILAVLTAAAGLVGAPAISTLDSASAFTGADFDPGYIISDSQFYNNSAMSEADIQSFLNAKIGSCQNGQCLNVLRVNTVDRPADDMCLVGYTGASAEPVARIIFKVQYSCGVSAKAILVTLQKEQGLVTSSAPSDGALRAAMGYGCPDTAACDSTYYGIFNQVYQAARQLKRYSLSAPDNISFHYYPVGAVSAIHYSPNAACGSGNVYIRNAATAALYYYTPYQPNAAALANLAGTGDGCSSYGNRNFWRYFYNWFGNPLAGAGDEQINAAYAASGGATGPLGASNGHACGDSSTCVALYANGAIYWTLSTGAYSVSGQMYTAYVGAGGPGGPLGWPLSSIVSSPANGGGTAQMFQNGSLYASTSGGVWALMGAFRDAYWSLGGSDGVLAWPTSYVVDVPQNGGGTAQSFQNGSLYLSKAGMFSVQSYTAVTYWAQGGAAGPLGWPTSAQITYSQNGGGVAQVFQNGSIYSSSAGAFVVSGAIRDAYWSAGGSIGAYGWPTGAQICASGGTGCSQSFQNGTISTDTGSYATDIAAVYRAAGGALGAATSDVILMTDNGGGAARAYQNGSIYSSVAGTFVVSGPTATAYWIRGGSAGKLGWPTAAAACTLAGLGCTQTYQNGIVYAAPNHPGFALSGSTAAAYANSGGPAGPLGWPVSDVVPIAQNGGGSGTEFQNGSIYSSNAGTFPVVGAIVKEYWARGGSAGGLGWPTSGLITVTENGGGTAQAFQAGSIYSSRSGTFTVTGATADAYWAQGGSTGPLGWPSSQVVAYAQNGGGTAQVYENGSVYASASGAFAVTGAVRDAYWAAGGSIGPYGWPTAAAVCSAGGRCTQQFQHGSLPAVG